MKWLGPQAVTLDPGNTAAVASAFATALQAKIADQFELARAWSGPLITNSERYDVWKILNGYDIRPGHKTGRLQQAMYDVKCWRLTGDAKRGITVTFSDAPLISAVFYAEFYIELKVRGGILMAFTKAWANEAASQAGVSKAAGRGVGPSSVPSAQRAALPRPIGAGLTTGLVRTFGAAGRATQPVIERRSIPLGTRVSLRALGAPPMPRGAR